MCLNGQTVAKIKRNAEPSKFRLLHTSLLTDLENFRLKLPENVDEISEASERCVRIIALLIQTLDNLTGPTSWHLGIAADKKKFANTAPVARDTIVTGLANPPEAIWANTPLVVTPSEGTLTAGRIAFAVFTLRLPVPDAV